MENTKKLLDKWSDSAYTFGGAAISGEGGGYGFGKLEGDHAERELLDFVFDAGVKVYDTAPIYGFGQSEVTLGEHFKSKREDIKLISKSGVNWHENKRVDMSNDPKVTRSMLEDSLRRLQTEYIDLYMIHWPDAKTDIRRAMEVLAKAKHEGKIHHIGLCNTYVEDLEKASEIEEVEVVQCEHNLFHGPNDELVQYIQEKDLSFMGWGTFDKGILTGRVNKKREQMKDYDDDDCRKTAPWWSQKVVLQKCEIMEKVAELAKEQELSLTEVALRYLSSHPWHTTTLMGAKTIADWENVLKVERKGLEQDLLDELNRLCQL